MDEPTFPPELEREMSELTALKYPGSIPDIFVPHSPQTTCAPGHQDDLTGHTYPVAYAHHPRRVTARHQVRQSIPAPSSPHSSPLSPAVSSRSRVRLPGPPPNLRCRASLPHLPADLIPRAHSRRRLFLPAAPATPSPPRRHVGSTTCVNDDHASPSPRLSTTSTPSTTLRNPATTP
ncbi:hypothetical protein R3P38DRAFT_3214337 [Favolaschia claudopus]|uniref:Uncharacterized protein n=1 Tax=Favolaschia claudopus TaxID=2862362 RepID=A0AAW0AAU9_9AGAR